KIGYSKSPLHRIKEIQATNPNTVTLVGYWDGLLYHEHSLHRRFAHCRKHGEWFAMTEKDLKDFHAYLPKRRTRGRPAPWYGPPLCLMCARKPRYSPVTGEMSCECGWRGTLPE